MNTISAVLERARAFKKKPTDRPRGDRLVPLDPLIKNSPSVRHAIEAMIKGTGCSREVAEDALMRARNCGEILTPEELAERLKVSVGWIYEKRRPRCVSPLPAIPMGRTIRFDWDAIVKWLEEQAAADAANLKARTNGRGMAKSASRARK